jgi:hypothetical protein
MKLFPTIAIASALALGACTTAQVSETETYATQVLAGLSAVLSSPVIEADLGANLAKAQASPPSALWCPSCLRAWTLRCRPRARRPACRCSRLSRSCPTRQPEPQRASFGAPQRRCE